MVLLPGFPSLCGIPLQARGREIAIFYEPIQQKIRG